MVDKPEIIETQRFEDFRGWLSVLVDSKHSAENTAHHHDGKEV